MPLRKRAKWGEYRWCENHAKPIVDAQGHIRYIVHSSRDIHERVIAEQALQVRTAELAEANAELARLARLKDEFVASMSHELRTPLTAILGLSEALHNGIFGNMSLEQQRMIATIDESGRYLLSLINNVLDLAKIDAQQVERTWEDVDVAACCDAALRLVTVMTQKKRQTVAYDIAPEVGTVVGDGRRLKQLLVNLLANAVKFTPDDGKIGLTVTREDDLGELQFMVWDTGIGIAPDDQSRLFEPFVQLDGRLAREYSGTGLGFALVKRMAECYDGRIELYSAPGMGSRFTLCLPWTRVMVETVVLPDDYDVMMQRPKGAAQPRILITEDNPVLQTLLTSVLEQQGFVVDVAAAGDEAIACARAVRPDLILMDIQMPGMDGLETTRRLKDDSICCAIPIVALTAYSMPGDRERCFHAGMTAYISKPFGIAQLMDTIIRCLTPVSI